MGHQRLEEGLLGGEGQAAQVSALRVERADESPSLGAAQDEVSDLGQQR
jgi:hypothetical protein